MLWKFIHSLDQSKEHKNILINKHQPFIDDGAALSAGKSNTQRSFESINWSGVTSFH